MGLEIPFSVETDVFGHTQEVELKANGKNIIVTDLNKVCEQFIIISSFFLKVLTGN